MPWSFKDGAAALSLSWLGSRHGGIAVKVEEEHVGCPKWYPVFLSGLGLTSLIFYQLFT